jgi:hypothetical protein
MDIHTIPPAQTGAVFAPLLFKASSKKGSAAVFETLKPLPPDAILGIMTLFRADQHPGKIDLSVGAPRRGAAPVLDSVKRAGDLAQERRPTSRSRATRSSTRASRS